MRSKSPLRSWTKKDFKLDWFSGSGSGGQHRNKHQNCLRLTEKESGITVVSQNSKSRVQNIKDALNRIAPLLVEFHFPKKARERSPSKQCVRIYNIPENRITDNASGHTTHFSEKALEDMVYARKKGLLEDD